MMKYADYIYEQDYAHFELPFYLWPCRNEEGKWEYTDIMNRHIDRQKLEDWKTRFFKKEGLATDTGRPSRSTLEKFGLAHVAEELDKHNRLGREEQE